MTEFDSALKDYYTKERVESLTYKDRPFYALVNKEEKFPGRKLPIPIIYGNNQAVSATFSVGQARAANTSSAIEAFELTRVHYYGFCQISSEVMQASEGDEGAWFDARTHEVNSTMSALTDKLAQALYKSGYGEVGIVATSGVSGSTITLATPSDIHAIEVGQVHCFSTSLNAAVLLGSGGTLTVTGVNKSTGVITYSAAVSTVTGVTDGVYIFLNGDRQNSATPSPLLVSGLSAWAPSAGPTSTSFFGVDRTMNTLLGGISYNGTSDAPEDAIITAATKMAAFGHKANYAFCSFEQFAKMCRAQRLLQRFEDQVTATVGFEGVIINGPKGPVKVVPDQFCPNTRCYVVDMSVLKLYSHKKAIRIVDDDGLMAQRLPSAAGIEVRMEFSGNLGCKAPSGICNVQLAAA